MPRVTLYVPDDLKTRMDAAGEAVNWSAVAQRAFMEAIATQAVRKDSSDMTSVVERLRASKERFEAAQLEFGRRCGSTWAKEAAEYDELERLSKLNKNDRDVGVETLQRVIDPTGEIIATEYGGHWYDFWEKFGDGAPTDFFACGFIEGAAEVFDEVADQL